MSPVHADCGLRPRCGPSEYPYPPRMIWFHLLIRTYSQVELSTLIRNALSDSWALHSDAQIFPNRSLGADPHLGLIYFFVLVGGTRRDEVPWRCAHYRMMNWRNKLSKREFLCCLYEQGRCALGELMMFPNQTPADCVNNKYAQSALGVLFTLGCCCVLSWWRRRVACWVENVSTRRHIPHLQFLRLQLCAA